MTGLLSGVSERASFAPVRPRVPCGRLPTMASREPGFALEAKRGDDGRAPGTCSRVVWTRASPLTAALTIVGV